MPTFRTVLPVKQTPISFNYQSNTLCIGSCFAENIGQLLIDSKFPCLLNPFGILYNPISIQQGLEMLLNEETYSRNTLFSNFGLWHSFDFHGEFSHPDKDIVLHQINESLANAKTFLRQTKRLILTFGTANVFIKKSTQQIVANCHKVPNQQFEKKRLTVTEIVNTLLPTLVKLKNVCPELEIIFTVSPVRHIKDGLIENQLSKATLLLATETLTKRLTFAHYFSAYELVLDDLRDYRFFEKDLIHPNEIAIQYIWEYFQQAYFSEKTSTIFNKIKKMVQASHHRPFHLQTEAHQQFVKKQLSIITQLEQQYAFLNLSKERTVFEQQLI